MAQMNSCNQIRTSSSIKSFRSCRHSTAIPLALLDHGRMRCGEARRLWHNVKQNWLMGSLKLSGARRKG
jgi:hypothetical protein